METLLGDIRMQLHFGWTYSMFKKNTRRRWAFWLIKLSCSNIIMSTLIIRLWLAICISGRNSADSCLSVGRDKMPWRFSVSNCLTAVQQFGVIRYVKKRWKSDANDRSVTIKEAPAESRLYSVNNCDCVNIYFVPWGRHFTLYLLCK